MDKIQKNSSKIFNVLLMIIPLIPYYRVLPEVINPVIFFTLCVILFLRKVNKIEGKDLYWLLFIAAALISILLSKDKIISFMNSFIVLCIVPLIFIVRSLSREETEKSRLFILYGGVLASAAGIVRNAMNTDPRLDGLFNYANASALYFAICAVIFFMGANGTKKQSSNLLKLCILPILTAMFLTQSRSGIVIYILAMAWIIYRNRENKQQFVVKALLYNGCALLTAVILLNKQFMALVLALPVIIWLLLSIDNLKIKKKKSRFGIYIISFAGLLFIFVKNFSRILNINMNISDLQERLVFYEDGIRIIKENLLGIGAGRFSSEQFRYQTAMYDIKYIHNGFLQLAIDYGIVFLIIFLAILFYNLFWKLNKERTGSVYFLISIMILLHSLIDFSMSFIYMDILLWFCIAANLKSENDILEKQEKSNNSLFFKSILMAVLVIMNLTMLIVLPGEIIYNAASNIIQKNNMEKGYKLLETWSSFPVKTTRYYDKTAAAAFKLYGQSKNQELLNQVIKNLETYKNMDSYDPRVYELLGKVYFSIGNYEEAAANLENSIDNRKFYIPNYDTLLEVNSMAYKNNKLSSEAYHERLKIIENSIVSLKKELNPRAKYMKDQPEGKLNEYEKMRINQ